MDVIQDAMAIGQDIEYNQEQLNDIINQQTESMNEGLEEEFAALDEDDMLNALDEFEDEGKNVNMNKGKKEVTNDFESQMNELLN